MTDNVPGTSHSNTAANELETRNQETNSVSNINDQQINAETEQPEVHVLTIPNAARITFRDTDTEQEWSECDVVGRAGKTGKEGKGKHRIWATVKMVDSGLKQSVNFENVEWKYVNESILLS